MDKPHSRITRELARVLQRDRELGWDLLEHRGARPDHRFAVHEHHRRDAVARRLGGMPRIEKTRAGMRKPRTRPCSKAIPNISRRSPRCCGTWTTTSTCPRTDRDHAGESDQWLNLLVLDDDGARGALEKALADAVVRPEGCRSMCPAEVRGAWVKGARGCVLYVDTSRIRRFRI